VDDDLVDCPNAQFTSIQAAVNASGPHDTVKVCPGTYREQIRIVGHVHDGLRIESLKPLQAVIEWPAAETPPLALVYFNLADGVTLRGFIIKGPFTFPGCSPDRHEGILVDDAFDERIVHNHITLIRNSVPALFGCQEGDAVAIGRRTTLIGTTGTTPGSARVEHNRIDEYQKNGVQVVNPGSVGHITHNVITGSSAVQFIIASNGVVVFGGATALVDHNVISNNKFTASALSTGVIVAETPPGSSSVNHNRLFDNDFGIQADTATNLDISHNDLFHHVSDAIVLCGEPDFFCGALTASKIRNNQIVENGGSGIALFGANSNLLQVNHVERNGVAAGDTTDGIRVDAASMQNRIAENHLEDNVTHDCHDESVGPGTAGTANFWVNDQGNTQNKPGLCK
jgi:parallel beta-helix repeat protein